MCTKCQSSFVLAPYWLKAYEKIVREFDSLVTDLSVGHLTKV